DGYVNVIDYACAHPSTAGSLPVMTTRPDCKLGTFGGTQVSAGRVAFRLEMGSHFEDNLAFDIVRDDSELPPDVLTAVDVDPRADPASPAFNPAAAQIYYNNGGGLKSVSRNTFLGVYGFPATTTVVPDLLSNTFQTIPKYGIPFDQRFIPSNPYTTSYATYNSAQGQRYTQGEMMHQWSVSNIMDWDVFPDVHLKMITGYREYQGAYAGDNSDAPTPFDLAVTYPTDREFQQEERFTGTLFGGKLEWTAGAFYYHRVNTATGPVIFDALNLVFAQNDKYTDENISGYGHVIYHITKPWEVFGGFRYTSEEKNYYFNHVGKVPGYPASGFFRDTVDPACTFVVDAACPANAPLVANKATTERPDWRAGTDYQITDDIMVYYQFSTGYRSGGFNSRPFDTLQLGSYNPETIISHEIGAKTDWFDHRLRLNVALFNADYNHTVVPISKIDSLGNPWVDYQNIGSSTDKGFELEATAAPVDNLLLTANYSYVDYTANPAPGSPPGFVDPGGTVKVGSAPILFPQQQANFSAQYTFDLGEKMGSLTPRLDYNWRSVVYEDANNNPYTELPALGLLNGRLTWDAPNDWEVAFSVSNLTDEHYFLARFNMAIFGLGTVSSEPAAPREWLVTLKKSF
ncbi:MAG: TonB-dependent receptor, partial [Alphaproteobacteria bacterium]|nr:TonB-dependent receptor [Alphaproteobacteria bacterium]